jgi:hypothetical protein
MTWGVVARIYPTRDVRASKKEGGLYGPYINRGKEVKEVSPLPFSKMMLL